MIIYSSIIVNLFAPKRDPTYIVEDRKEEGEKQISQRKARGKKEINQE
ncbi:MAG: hypothetical protein ACMUEL_01020 [Flavobacteriales bacterium Tduv]